MEMTAKSPRKGLLITSIEEGYLHCIKDVRKVLHRKTTFEKASTEKDS